MKIKLSKAFSVTLVFHFLFACQASPQLTSAPNTTKLPPTSTPTKIHTTPTSTSTSTPVPKGVCANVLYPLLQGNEWVYQASGADTQSHITFQVTSTQNDLASIHVVDEQAGVTTDDTVRCADGAVINLPLVFMSLMLSDYVDGVVNTYQESGITSPSLDTFVENSWHFAWEIEKLVEQSVKVEIPGLGSGNILPGNTIKFKSETVGTRESVTVPAGIYPQAILVTVEMRAPITIGNAGAIFIVNYREWYEPYTGLLKLQTDSAGLDYSGMPIPVPLDKTLELVSYQAGTP